MEFNELIAGFATRHNVTNLAAIDNVAAALRRTPRNPHPLVGGEAPLPVRATARDVLKPHPLVGGEAPLPVRAAARDVLKSLPVVGGEAPLPVRATARDVLKPLPVVAFFNRFHFVEGCLRTSSPASLRQIKSKWRNI